MLNIDKHIEEIKSQISDNDLNIKWFEFQYKHYPNERLKHMLIKILNHKVILNKHLRRFKIYKMNINE
jgi:hypothetical protein